MPPFIPENAPFTPEQRSWLNGFFAGIFSGQSSAASPDSPSPSEPVPLTILFGSQTGTTETLAKTAAREAGKRGFNATVHDLAEYPKEQLKVEQYLLLMTSTYGDGDPPDNAVGFWEYLNQDAAPALPDLQFSVLALGDTNYEKFCECGRRFDERLEALQARRIHPRTDCDLDYEEPFREWLNGVLSELEKAGAEHRSGPVPVSAETSPVAEGASKPQTEPAEEAVPAGTRKNPIAARLAMNKKLNGSGSNKDTRHFEVDLSGSGLAYETGDALGVMPRNCPELAGGLIHKLDCNEDEPVPNPAGEIVALREALLHHYDLIHPSASLLKELADRAKDERLQGLLDPKAKTALAEFLQGRDLIDLFHDTKVRLTGEELVGRLKKLQPRLYSIASSPRAHPDQIHLTVATVRYSAHGRDRKGVCSTYLAERLSAEENLSVFVQRNPSFGLPADGDRPIILVGPGTGIAPFRAFLQERRATGAKGKNWLFFGDQKEKSDFLYREELEGFRKEGVLTRLTTAFSRDQTEKCYVQHRMRESAEDLYAWLEEGACFYVCGDAKRMAKDVDRALHDVLIQAGGFSEDQAAEYVRRMKTEKRYLRDVY